MSPFFPRQPRPPLAALVAALDAFGVKYTAEDVADAFWLHRRQFPAAYRPARSPASQPEITPAEPFPRSEPPTIPPRPEPSQTLSSPRPSPRGQAPAVSLRVAEPREPPAADELPVDAPAPPPLTDRRDIIRSLRPLLARHASRTRRKLDVEATARRRAEEGFLELVEMPDRDRWLNVALVIDTAASMEVWQPTLRAVRQLFASPGLFHGVRTWFLGTDGREPDIRTATRVAHPAGALVRSPGEVVPPGSASLVVILSDCVSEAWYWNTLPGWIADWSRRAGVAVLDVLPPRMWRRTALGPAVGGNLQSLGTTGFNGRLSWAPDWDFASPPVGKPVPVATLDPAALYPLARILAGRSGASVRGVILGREHPGRPLGTEAVSEDPDLAVKLVESFRRTASVPAQYLAALLAASPVISLPVIRLLSRVVPPDAADGEETGALDRPEYLAEVWLGGLLQALPGTAKESDPDAVRYGFRFDPVETAEYEVVRAGAVRQLLLDHLPRTEARRVLLAVSRYIAATFGRMRGLPGFLQNPRPSDQPFGPGDEPFALITLDILRRLGGPFARFADAAIARGTVVPDLLLPSDYPPQSYSRVLIPRIQDQFTDLHAVVRKWTEHIPVNLPYVDLLFAFGFGTLGDTATAKRLLDHARAVMDLPIPTSTDRRHDSAKAAAVVRQFLYKTFQFRIEQVLAGKPASGPMSGELIEALDEIVKQGGSGQVNSPYKLAKYAIDRMRERSKILEPQEKPDPYADWTKYGDELKKSLWELQSVRGPVKLADRIRRLYREGVPGRPAGEVQFLVLHETLPLAPRVGEAFTVELLNLVPAALATPLAKGPTGEAADLLKKQGELLERALFLAGHFDRRDLVQKLVGQFADLVRSKKEDARFQLINTVVGQCLHSLRKLGMRDEIDRLLTRLQAEVLQGSSPAEVRKKYAAKAEHAGTLLQTFVNLAAGWLTFGLNSQASPILETARNELLSPTGLNLPAKNYTELARAYVSALGQGASETGLPRISELFQKMDPKKITNTWNTSPFYSWLHLKLVEEAVLAVCRMVLEPPLN